MYANLKIDDARVRQFVNETIHLKDMLKLWTDKEIASYALKLADKIEAYAAKHQPEFGIIDGMDIPCPDGLYLRLIHAAKLYGFIASKQNDMPVRRDAAQEAINLLRSIYADIEAEYPILEAKLRSY